MNVILDELQHTRLFKEQFYRSKNSFSFPTIPVTTTRLARRAFEFANVGNVLQQWCSLAARLGLGGIALFAQRR